MNNTHLLIPIQKYDLEELDFWLSMMEDYEHNEKGKVITLLRKMLSKSKQISLDEKDIEEEAINQYYYQHNWDKEEQKRESIINMAKESEFTSGYKQALKNLF